MCIGIFSFRAFDRRLARLAPPISSGVRQGGGAESAPPAGRVRLNTPAGRGLSALVVYASSAQLRTGIIDDVKTEIIRTKQIRGYCSSIPQHVKRRVVEVARFDGS